MGFKRFIGFMWVPNPFEPVDPGFGGGIGAPGDPGYGHPDWSPIDPGFGGGRPQPPDPGYGHPGIGAGLPGHDLPGGPGHVWGTLIQWLLRPQIGGGPAKPPGLRPVLPPSIDNGLPPNGGEPPHPWLPGHWEPVDPGFGKPPLWGFIGIDNGLPTPPGRPPEIGGGLPTPPGRPPQVGGGLPTPPGLHPGNKPPGGIWVPTDPGFGKPIRPCPPVTGKPHPPIWAWIPDRPPMPGETPATVTLNPTTGTVLASGGSGSVNVTVTGGDGTWTVDPASVPDWVTITPMSAHGDKNMTYAATKNTTGQPKQALISVSGSTFTLNQGAV